MSILHTLNTLDIAKASFEASKGSEWLLCLFHKNMILRSDIQKWHFLRVCGTCSTHRAVQSELYRAQHYGFQTSTGL